VAFLETAVQALPEVCAERLARKIRECAAILWRNWARHCWSIRRGWVALQVWPNWVPPGPKLERVADGVRVVCDPYGCPPPPGIPPTLHLSLTLPYVTSWDVARSRRKFRTALSLLPQEWSAADGTTAHEVFTGPAVVPDQPARLHWQVALSRQPREGQRAWKQRLGMEFERQVIPILKQITSKHVDLSPCYPSPLLFLRSITMARLDEALACFDHYAAGLRYRDIARVLRPHQNPSRWPTDPTRGDKRGTALKHSEKRIARAVQRMRDAILRGQPAHHAAFFCPIVHPEEACPLDCPNGKQWNQRLARALPRESTGRLAHEYSENAWDRKHFRAAWDSVG
jgi:hypothetical protein